MKRSWTRFFLLVLSIAAVNFVSAQEENPATDSDKVYSIEELSQKSTNSEENIKSQTKYENAAPVELRPKINEDGESFVDLALKKIKAELKEKMGPNPIALLPRDQVKKIIQEQFKETPIGALMESSSSTLDFTVDFVMHPTASMNLISILLNGEKAKLFFFCLLSLIILVILISLLKREGPKAKNSDRFMKRFFSYLLVMGGGLACFYYIYQEEVNPTLEIFRRYYLSF